MSLAKIYLFHIKMLNSKEYYLTSGNREVTYRGNIYVPESGLSLVSGEFNDSAENNIVLHGIFEKNGISKNDQFMGAVVKIMYLENQQIKNLVTYICTQYNINDLDFEIRCESEAIKYNKSLLQIFSKTCRANFGDNKCKININNYKVVCNLLEVNANILMCDNINNFHNEYFRNGRVKINDQELKIIAHNGNKIEIENNKGLKDDLSRCKQLTLTPGCDKKFRTCCYSFNNAVNFRGEPDIPESNIIKN